LQKTADGGLAAVHNVQPHAARVNGNFRDLGAGARPAGSTRSGGPSGLPAATPILKAHPRYTQIDFADLRNRRLRDLVDA
jgi:hypothetical protein